MNEPSSIDGYELCANVLAATKLDVGPLLTLTGGAETDWLEFKEAPNPSNPWRVAKAVVALANTHGGCVLIGVDDSGRAVGLDASDPTEIRRREGYDGFLRHFEDVVLRPRSGWTVPKAGRVVLDESAPHDLVELHVGTLENVHVLAILVRPRPAGDRCLHVVEGPAEKERSYVPVRKLGTMGRIADLVRPGEVEAWQTGRRPRQVRYAELLDSFRSTRANPVSEAAAELEERILNYRRASQRLLEKVDHCFITLDAEERADLEVQAPLQPWAEEYLAEDLGWETNDDFESAERQVAAIESATAGAEENRASRSGGIFDLLAQEKQAIILGEPGGGKTTCLKRVVLQTLEKYQSRRAVAVFVPLSRFAGAGDLLPLISRATSWGREPSESLSAADVEFLIRAGRIVLCFDALNECAGQYYDTCVRELADFVSHHRNLPVTISSRIIGWQRELQLPVFVLRPLSSEQQRLLLTRFLEDEESAQEVQRELIALPGGATTASNPLVLRMAIQIYRGDGHLPAGRALLYRRFFELWYAREAHKARLSGVPLEWDEQTVRAALARVAFYSRADGERVITRVKAENLLGREIPAPGRFFERLGQGFLLRAVDTEVEFGHESFQEYFAAEYCVQFPPEIAHANNAQYDQWGMVIAYAHELVRDRLQAEVVEVAWRLNPWLGAVVTPTGKPLPPNWDLYTIAWTSSARECLRLFSYGLAASVDAFGIGFGWYTREDAALSYAVMSDVAVQREWRALEVHLLRAAWHPALAVAFLRRALTAPLDLVADAWPVKSLREDERSWRVPKSWLTRATPAVAHHLIELGALRAEDFTPYKQDLALQATPTQARQWIEAGVLSYSDLKERKSEWLATGSLQNAAELVAAGLCAFGEFRKRKEELLESSTPAEAAASVALGVCTVDEFSAQKPEWIAKASAKEAKRLIRSGLCSPEDFAARRVKIAKSPRPSTACLWIASGVCTARDFSDNRVQWSSTVTPKQALRLISFGICSAEDFRSRDKTWLIGCKPATIRRLLAAKICAAEDFPQWVSDQQQQQCGSTARGDGVPAHPLNQQTLASTWPKLIGLLIRCSQGNERSPAKREALLAPDSPLRGWEPQGDDLLALRHAQGAVDRFRLGATCDDCDAFSKAFEHAGDHWDELKRLAVLYLTALGVETSVEVLRASTTIELEPPFVKAQLSDSQSRFAIARRLKRKRIAANVNLCEEGYCFLAHPDFPDGIFCTTARPKGELPLGAGDHVECEVIVRRDQKRAVWSFAASKVVIRQRATAAGD